MVVSEESRLVDFDAEAALAAAREVDRDAVHICVEYTESEFHTLYADEATMALYDDRAAMESHFEEVHSYVHIDFTETDLFGELFRAAGDVRSFVTVMEHATVLRVLVGSQGLFFSTDPEADVTALVTAVEDAID
ncbi:hypothetical protein [Halorussus marinus]|uniref:hypothetical protein n=1 Tax=Halorussus marinus TaxID=2505976 RepID=UPI00106DE8F0|nr:hypothetical protein [Halorussus marinus]